ncbi:MAG: TPM domain-containing protein [Sulfurovaceae bacterium]|nr:TPM domain-containing protein [Sulfurovaceae bacterium]
MKLFKSITLLMLLACLAFSAPTFPKLNNSRVVDDAGLFDENQKINLDKKLANHETNTSNQIVVVTVKSLDGYDISDYGYQLGRYWGIGQKDKNNGILLIVAPNERKVRIEVGYGLEGILPDATSKTIIQNDILPSFKKGDYYNGVNNGVDKIMATIKGEYKPTKSTNQNTSIGFLLPILFIVIIFINVMPKSEDKKKRLIPAIISGSVAGIISWVIFFVLGVSIFIAVIVFLLTLFGSNSNWSDGNYHSTSGGFGGSDFGSSDFGGFSSGGGSFGGGGASGDW